MIITGHSSGSCTSATAPTVVTTSMTPKSHTKFDGNPDSGNIPKQSNTVQSELCGPPPRPSRSKKRQSTRDRTVFDRKGDAAKTKDPTSTSRTSPPPLVPPPPSDSRLCWDRAVVIHKERSEKQQKRQSDQHFVLIPTVPGNQQNRQSTRYLGRDRAVVVDKQRRSEDEDPNGNSSSMSIKQVVLLK